MDQIHRFYLCVKYWLLYILSKYFAYHNLGIVVSILLLIGRCVNYYRCRLDWYFSKSSYFSAFYPKPTFYIWSQPQWWPPSSIPCLLFTLQWSWPIFLSIYNPMIQTDTHKHIHIYIWHVLVMCL